MWVDSNQGHPGLAKTKQRKDSILLIWYSLYIINCSEFYAKNKEDRGNLNYACGLHSGLSSLTHSFSDTLSVQQTFEIIQESKISNVLLIF